MNNNENKTLYENITYPILNTTLKSYKKVKPLQKLAYYFLILLMLVFIFFFITILVLLIRKRIRKMYEKMRRLKLQQEINKIMMIDIFETRSPSLDTNISGFHSISNDSTLGEISSSNNVLSEINAKNSERNSKGSNDS
jgi:predicted PurR-regulated permease PerM